MGTKRTVRYSFLQVILIYTLLLAAHNAFSQSITMEPPYWYAGLTDSDLTILVHGNDIAPLAIDSKHSNKIREGSKLSKNYKLVIISHELLKKPGTIKFNIGSNRLRFTVKKRASRTIPKVMPSTNMYRIFPDRFANGNPTNDNVSHYHDTLNRNISKGRHGGDLEGITQHIDYLKNLHINALLLNPILENNQKVASYHGYATTNFYKVDERLGSMNDYQRLCSEMNANGIGVLQDVVYNHIGSEHAWMTDMPDSNWINWFDEFTPSNYRAVTFIDPHASAYDLETFNDGWFVPTMPDLNQRDSNLATYLIQNTIWWIETAGLSGFRIDTYAYPDNQFMQSLNKAVKLVFPDCYIYGEIWERGEVTQAGFSPNNIQHMPTQGLDGITDYNLYFSMLSWMEDAEGWNTGLARLYYALATDGLYTQPDYLLTFVDNHDQDRFFGKLDGDFAKWKQAITFLLTTRGIPCIYYGTELLWTESGDHGLLRKDFPGGWSEDTISKFTREGRNKAENEAFDFLQILLGLRANHSDIFSGALIHFVPTDGVYAYFRVSENNHDILMVLLCNDEKDHILDTSKYQELGISNFSKATDILTSTEVDLQNLSVTKESPVVILLRK